MLAQDIFQFDSGTFIKGDFTLSFIDLHFLVVALPLGGPVEQIEVGIDRKLCLLQAPVTIGLHPNLEVTADPDFPQRVRQKFGRTVRLEWRRLSQSLPV